MTAVLRRVWWWVGALMGDHDYARYVELHRRLHPGEPVPTEREYWRDRHAATDSNPGARCC
ncbi:YbdD/YjiX family protein [Rhodococcus sp. NPDC003382]|uniref:YbdD/YjiX family protein n=1 Tax=unclassified Rhodococcus (in: high G+C Gram-positive bacteria) TaxID=192944 RepID=UPI0018CFAF9B|nr:MULTISPECIES: YbdD/YjiX family protein [unclassified Rhodococcus (in: high G+C Gram-positive bacteria)]MBH0121145.1 YbdD/YjiX family protein [Rhodococcus sp. CX]